MESMSVRSLRYKIPVSYGESSVTHTFPSPFVLACVLVFGKVTEGLDVIDKIEMVGSQSGKTSQKVVIKDCGEV
jgi:cyclophilin family peptidyl-prolyl cis-trans isomerase